MTPTRGWLISQTQKHRPFFLCQGFEIKASKYCWKEPPILLVSTGGPYQPPRCLSAERHYHQCLQPRQRPKDGWPLSSLSHAPSRVQPKALMAKNQQQRGLAHYLREQFVSRHLPSSSYCAIVSPTSPQTAPETNLHHDLFTAINLVQRYDPSGYLPGMLLSTSEARVGYFALRALWVETGLRFGFGTWPSYCHGEIDDEFGDNNKKTSEIKWKYDINTPEGRLQFWQAGLDSIFWSTDHTEKEALWKSHPTLRLLRYLYTTPSSLLSHITKIAANETKT